MIEESVNYCPRCATALTHQLHSGKQRPVCPKCGWVFFPDPKVAVVVLIRKENRVLLVQRIFEPQKGRWTLPSGFVDAGEDPKVAVQRECLEETGLEVGNLRLLDMIYSQEFPRGASILLLYQAEVQSGELRPGDDAGQVGYFHINELPPLAFSSTLHILDVFF